MKGFDIALWPNDRKEPGSRQPDATGSISIPISVLRELSQAYQAKELPTTHDTRNDQEVIKLDVSAWRNAPVEGKRTPVIKAEVRSWSEQKERLEAMKPKSETPSDAGEAWNLPF